METFRIHVADEVLDDLRVRLRRTRWPDQVPGIGWKQGTDLEWLQHLVSYWADEFDWRAWERRLNALNHFIWEGIHFVYQRPASGRGVPLILTHGWPSSFLDFVEMLRRANRNWLRQSHRRVAVNENRERCHASIRVNTRTLSRKRSFDYPIWTSRIASKASHLTRDPSDVFRS